MSAEVPDYWPLFEAYHRVREPVYRAIVADAHLAADAVMLDAACGDAFYSRLIADMLGRDAHIVAVDRNPALLRSQSIPDRAILLCYGDLEQIGLKHGAFDVIWLCRSMHAALDPLRRLSALVPLLRPGGKLIVIENDLAHCPILSWPADFEGRIQAALHQHLHSRSPDGASIERYHAGRHLPAWLKQVGLRHVSIHTYPVEDVAPMTDDVETYWKLAMDYLGKLIWPFLSPGDRRAYSRAFDPESPDYLLDRPGFYCLEPITVGCGTAP
jgi:SAM-dependent methyltransferase